MRLPSLATADAYQLQHVCMSSDRMSSIVAQMHKDVKNLKIILGPDGRRVDGMDDMPAGRHGIGILDGILKSFVTRRNMKRRIGIKLCRA